MYCLIFNILLNYELTSRRPCIMQGWMHENNFLNIIIIFFKYYCGLIIIQIIINNKYFYFIFFSL